MFYRTYDHAWNRTGYAQEPQYPGQEGMTDDYPAKCHCGSEMAGCGDTAWLRLRAEQRLKPDLAYPDWVEDAEGYVAWCRNGHSMERQPITS